MNIRVTLSVALALVLVSCATAPDQSPQSELKRSVVSIHNMLQSKQYESAVQTLFGLSDPNEISNAVEHLQRPRCLEMYNVLFSELLALEPRVEQDMLGHYSVAELVLSWDTFEKMGVMFYRVADRWRFNDPSFDRKLGRRLIDDLQKEIEQFSRDDS